MGLSRGTLSPAWGHRGRLTWLGTHAVGAAAAGATLLSRAARGVIVAARPAALPAGTAGARAVAWALCRGRCSMQPCAQGAGLVPGAPDTGTGPRPQPSRRPVPTLASLGGEPAVPVVGRRQVLTCPLWQHFSAPGQLWSERQNSLGGRGAPLPLAGHSPTLPGAGRTVGGQRPCGARRGAGVTAGAAPWSPVPCWWAGVGDSSTNSARSTRRRVRLPGIVLLSEGCAVGPAGQDLNPARAGAGQAELLFPMAAPY